MSKQKVKLPKDRRWIAGYEQRYAVGSDGLVYSYCLDAKGQVRKATQQHAGHMKVSLRDSHGRGRRLSVHHLVLESFGFPRPAGKSCCRHLDGNPANNRIENLTWGSYTENAADRLRHGNQSMHVAKLTKDQVREIRKRHAAGETQAYLAACYGVNQPAISKIVRWQSWADVV